MEWALDQALNEVSVFGKARAEVSHLQIADYT